MTFLAGSQVSDRCPVSYLFVYFYSLGDIRVTSLLFVMCSLFSVGDSSSENMMKHTLLQKPQNFYSLPEPSWRTDLDMMTGLISCCHSAHRHRVGEQSVL